MLNCVGDIILDGLPCYMDRVDSYSSEIPVFGGICEGFEYVWRCIGSENALYWMFEEPDLFEDFTIRVGDFLAELTAYQIEEAGDRLSGIYIWGDVAYVNGMMFSPDMWRRFFKPITQRLIKIIRDAGLMVIYHGCGDARMIFEDFIEIGLMGLNPAEVKADQDLPALMEKYGGRLAFAGNIDVRILESGNKKRILKETLRKLRAAQNGGWIAQSDHSISSGVEIESYEFFLEIMREYGAYPLDFDKIDKKLAELNQTAKEMLL
jgi:uroporphyrinogen-III decarboxylase